jgi:DNA-binding NarL/FixJ family response regulator
VNDSDGRNAGEPIRVLIAEDHALVRTGLCMIVGDEPDMEVVGEVSDGAEALALALALLPTVVLADISMPPPDGIELARLLCRDAPGVKTIMVTMHEDEVTVQEAAAAGAAGFVVKRSGPDELVQAIRRVVAGERYLDARLRERGMKFGEE